MTKGGAFIELELVPGICFPMGSESIIWRVISVDAEAKTAVIYADSSVCWKTYDESDRDVTWSECSLRFWLNGEYYETAFSDEEKAAIVKCKISTPDFRNPENGEVQATGGADTEDYVWLLSNEEYRSVRNVHGIRYAYGTDYWLRSPGSAQAKAAMLCNNGRISMEGEKVNVKAGVRPALKINLEAPLFKAKQEAPASDNGKLTIRIPQLTIRDDIVIRCSTGAEEVDIPEGVTEIAGGCFNFCGELSKVTLPSTLKILGDSSFRRCINLESIDIPAGVEMIGPRPYDSQKPQVCHVANSNVLIGSVLYCEGVEDIVIPEGITELPAFCITRKRYLETLTLPSTLRKISSEGIVDCEALETVTVKSSSIEYAEDIFRGCYNLRFTPDMFRNTGRLSDAFLRNVDVCGPEELAFCLMYQEGERWRAALAERINEENADAVMQAIVKHIEETDIADFQTGLTAVFIADYAGSIKPGTIEAFLNTAQGRECYETAQLIQAAEAARNENEALDTAALKLCSRKELNAELAKLKASAKNYPAPPRESAMCYSRARDSYMLHKYTCSCCGKEGYMNVAKIHYQDSEMLADPIIRYKMFIEDFNILGYRAELSEYCENCVGEKGDNGEWIKKQPGPVVMSIWLSDEDEPVVYCPNPYRCEPRDLLLAQEFLAGKRTVAALSKPNHFKRQNECNDADTIMRAVMNVFSTRKEDSYDRADYVDLDNIPGGDLEKYKEELERGNRFYGRL